MLGTGIVTFITHAAGQLVCKDLQWGNRIFEQLKMLSCHADSISKPSPLTYRFEVPLQGRDNGLLSLEQYE